VIDIRPLLRSLEYSLRTAVVSDTRKFTGNFPVQPQPMVTPQGANQSPSNYVNSFFNAAANVTAECNNAALKVEEMGIIDTIGASDYDAVGDPPLKYSPVSAAKAALGDWGYFQNYRDYQRLNPKGDWQGENVIKIAKGPILGIPPRCTKRGRMGRRTQE